MNDLDALQPTTAKDVDLITAKRISDLHGPTPWDEIKNLRKGMMSIASLVFKQPIPGMTMKQAENTATNLLNLNKRIEEIVQEGKDYKKTKGLI
jgi:hypothetical protein